MPTTQRLPTHTSTPDVPPPSVPEHPTTRETFDSLVRAVGAIIVIMIFVGFFAGLTGCAAPAVKPSVTRQPVETPSVDRKNAINRACFQFHRYIPVDLARPTVEGDVNYVAGLPGVPAAIQGAIARYYDDPAVRNPNNNAGRTAASVAYGKVTAACQYDGWQTGVPAGDQPPKR